MVDFWGLRTGSVVSSSCGLVSFCEAVACWGLALAGGVLTCVNAGAAKASSSVAVQRGARGDRSVAVRRGDERAVEEARRSEPWRSFIRSAPLCVQAYPLSARRMGRATQMLYSANSISLKEASGIQHAFQSTKRGG